MKTQTLETIAQFTRPFMQKRTPVMFRLCKGLLRRMCPVGTTSEGELVAQTNGNRVYVDLSSSLEYNIFFRGNYEPEVARVLQAVVKPGYTCLDVGANIGAHALMMAKSAGPTGRVVALEPHPAICKRLRRNIELNGTSNITVVEAALSSEDGNVDFFGFDEGAEVQSTSSLRPNKNSSKKMSVRAVSGTTLAKEANIDVCHVIKIDVEGAETIVLQSLSGWIEKWKPCLVFEYRERLWKQFDADVSAIVEDLKSQSYRIFVISRKSIEPLGGAVPDHSDLLCVPPGANVDLTSLGI